MRAIPDLGPNRWPRIADGFPRFARRRPPSPPARLPARPDGTLLACQGGAGALIRIDPATKAIETLATELVVDGTSRKLGRVNDLSSDATGGIYFTDPALGKPSATSGVPYRDTAGAVTRVDTSVDGPNGACGADAPGRPSGHS